MANFHAKEWLKSAYSDLRNIHYIINDAFLSHMVAFHSQQAIEKSLKVIFPCSSNCVWEHLDTYILKIFNNEIDKKQLSIYHLHIYKLIYALV